MLDAVVRESGSPEGQGTPYPFGDVAKAKYPIKKALETERSARITGPLGQPCVTTSPI